MSCLRPSSLSVTSLACATLVSCVPTEHGAWREEVELSDGRTIVVERTVTWQESQAFGENKSYIVREMTVSLPSNAQQAPPPAWHGTQERALLLEFDADRQEYVLVTLLATCARFVEAGRPRPPYLEYVLRNGEWSMVPLDQELIGKRANLIAYPRVTYEPALLTAAEKATREASSSGRGRSILAIGAGLGEC